MSAEQQRIVVLQDASRDVSTSAIKKFLKGLPLKPGDELTLVAILDHLSSPSMFSFLGGRRLGYKVKVDRNSFFATTPKIVDEELSRIKHNYPSSRQVTKLSQFCEENKIVFQVEVLPGPSSEVAIDAARSYNATWLILDKQMNKDTRQNMDHLPFGMMRIRSDNSFDRLREPLNITSLHQRPPHVRYKEMIPGDPEEEVSPKRLRSSPSEQLMTTGVSYFGSTEASTSSLEGAQYHFLKYQGEQNAPTAKQKTEAQAPLFYFSQNQEICQRGVHHWVRPIDHQEQYSSHNEASQMEEEFTNPLCSVCQNKRPEIGKKKDFTYAELWTATQGFSQKNFLSEGGFGTVYRGQLNGMKIAVKQHKNASFQGEKEFKSEVNVLSKARHENVVMLLGSCSEGNSRLLVYEYVCNGSLDQHLSQHSRSPLSWEDRIRIAIGAAKGLLYLHKNNIIHRDMRPNNILITHDHEPLLGDFGLARTQEDTLQSTEVVGTLGYLAPEYAEYGKVSTKTDVYSFGVVLLELITGMRTTDKRLGWRSLVGWARPLLRERNYPDLIDERIINCHDFYQLFWMVRIAEKCLSKDPQKRLSMVAVVNALSRIMEGNTCGLIIRDCSPARSDSFYSTSDSDESESEMPGCEGELESSRTDSTSSSSMIQMTQMIVRLPPSPPVESISSSRSSSFTAYATIETEAQIERYRAIS